MVLEIAVGVFAGWLWQKIADTARTKDEETAIKRAIEEAVRQARTACFGAHLGDR